MFLEDTPYHSRANRPDHLIFGPYEVFAPEMPEGSVPVEVDGVRVAYRHPHPEDGPWEKRWKVRDWGSVRARFYQDPTEYGYFPLRFVIIP